MLLLAFCFSFVLIFGGAPWLLLETNMLSCRADDSCFPFPRFWNPKLQQGCHVVRVWVLRVLRKSVHVFLFCSVA